MGDNSKKISGLRSLTKVVMSDGSSPSVSSMSKTESEANLDALAGGGPVYCGPCNNPADCGLPYYIKSETYNRTEIDGFLALKEDWANKVITITAESDNKQYPSAKAVYDIVSEVSGGTSEALRELSGYTHSNIDRIDREIIITNNKVGELSSYTQSSVMRLDARIDSTIFIVNELSGYTVAQVEEIDRRLVATNVRIDTNVAHIIELSGSVRDIITDIGEICADLLHLSGETMDIDRRVRELSGTTGNINERVTRLENHPDIVGVVNNLTDLALFDTTYLKVGDVIKVVHDSVYNDMPTYYKWQFNRTWVYMFTETENFHVGTINKTTTNFASGETYTIQSALQRTANLFEGFRQDFIDVIESKIPEQATAQNQLADKAFVNSTVATYAANFRGNWPTWADVPAVASGYPEDYAGHKTPTNNDYMVVQDSSDYSGQTLDGQWRFMYVGKWAELGKAGWKPQYRVGKAFTAAQQAAIDSNITAALTAQITINQTNIGDLQTNKVDKINTAFKVYGTDSQGAQIGYTAGDGIGFVNGQIVNTRRSAEWGNIVGNIQDQEDLQEEFATKLNVISGGTEGDFVLVDADGQVRDGNIKWVDPSGTTTPDTSYALQGDLMYLQMLTLASI